MKVLAAVQVWCLCPLCLTTCLLAAVQTSFATPAVELDYKMSAATSGGTRCNSDLCCVFFPCCINHAGWFCCPCC